MLRLFAEDHDIDVTHLFLQIISLPVAPVDRQAEIGDRRPAGRIPQFRVLREIPDQNDLIEPCHDRPPYHDRPPQPRGRPSERRPSEELPVEERPVPPAPSET